MVACLSPASIRPIRPRSPLAHPCLLSACSNNGVATVVPPPCCPLSLPRAELRQCKRTLRCVWFAALTGGTAARSTVNDAGCCPRVAWHPAALLGPCSSRPLCRSARLACAAVPSFWCGHSGFSPPIPTARQDRLLHLAHHHQAQRRSSLPVSSTEPQRGLGDWSNY